MKLVKLSKEDISNILSLDCEITEDIYVYIRKNGNDIIDGDILRYYNQYKFKNGIIYHNVVNIYLESDDYNKLINLK
jgi:hypothetical protein